MQEKTTDELVDEVIDRLLGGHNALRRATMLGGGGSRIDTSKPNIHDNKADFVRERDAVMGGIEKFEQALSHMRPNKDDIEQTAMIERLTKAIDKEAAKTLRYTGLEEAYELAMRNVVQTGFYINTLLITLRMVGLLKDRPKELQEQEVEFWSISNRAPNYYARTIALRLARLYARQKGHFPTFGTSRDGGHPSTEYGRALEEIFHIIGITARVPNAAKWAIEQLTDLDIAPEQNVPMGGLWGRPTAPKPVRDKGSVTNALVQSEKKGG